MTKKYHHQILLIGVLHCSLLLGFTYCAAQSSVQGAIMDSEGKPVSGATVLLLYAADSSLAYATLTDTAGRYSFKKLESGMFLITATHIGFAQSFGARFEATGNKRNEEQPQIVMGIEKDRLSKVMITAKKPFLEQKTDRLIINVSNSITSPGNTALEILERSPGVAIDRTNNTLSMNGKSGLVVMLNGKVNRMPVTAVIQMLSALSAGNIDKLELITTPPASFDAEGNAGYINIVLKENDSYGANASFSTTTGYGKGLVMQNNINANYRKGKINLYGDLSYSVIRSPFYLDTYRRFTNQSGLSEKRFHIDRSTTVANINGRAGFDIQLSSRTIIGGLLSGYNNRFSQHEMNEALQYKNGRVDTSMKLSNTEINHWSNYSVDINLQRTYAKEGRLTFNLDLVRYFNNQPVNYSTDYYDGNGYFLQNEQNTSGKETSIHFWVFMVNFNKRVSKNIIMESGLKATLSAFNNEIIFWRLKSAGRVQDSILSSTYKLIEDYAAAFTSFNITLTKKTIVNAGLRYEYTRSNLGTRLTRNFIDRDYGSFFPNLSLTHKINNKHLISFSYSRRITRPTFNDLAPFVYFTDANSLITGNPQLRPSFSNTIKFDYSFKKYFFSISLNKDDNAIGSFQPSIDSISGKFVVSPTNLINQKTASIAISIPITVAKYWTMQHNLTGLWQQVNALYHEAPVRISQYRFQLNSTINFSLPKAFSIEVAGFYQSKGLRGIFITKASGSLDLGISKKLPDKKGAIIFSIVNTLNTLRGGMYTDMPEQNIYVNTNFRFTQRTYKLSYTRNIGKESLKQKRDRLTGAEEEKKRIQ